MREGHLLAPKEERERTLELGRVERKYRGTVLEEHGGSSTDLTNEFEVISLNVDVLVESFTVVHVKVDCGVSMVLRDPRVSGIPGTGQKVLLLVRVYKMLPTVSSPYHPLCPLAHSRS
jgi:hypothetical protein